MMILATFFPTSESPDVKGEFFKTTVDIVDLVGLHLVMSRISGKAEIKFLVAGVGWATAELIMTRFIPLWVGARGIEFDWKYIQMSLDSNLSLLQYVATATLVWLWSRNDLQPRSLLPVIVILLGLSCFSNLLSPPVFPCSRSKYSWDIPRLPLPPTAGDRVLAREQNKKTKRHI